MIIHIDLDKSHPVAAVKAIVYWIERYKIQELNVAGPRASRDPRIHDEVKNLVLSVLHLCADALALPESAVNKPIIPATVGEAVEDLISVLPLHDKSILAQIDRIDLEVFRPFLGKFIRNRYGLWKGNKMLLASCRAVSGKEDIHPDDASILIMDELWKRLREIHVLKVIK